MELSARLKSVADQVPSGVVLADIGTDHAYLPVWLLLNGQISSAIAADLREGPLSRARETAALYGVSDKISFRLCNGLADIAAHEADVISIAGMGGETIAAILNAAPWTKEGKVLLLQPMTSFPDLRLWLQENGYCIEREILSKEGRRLYSCLVVRGGEMTPLTPAELWVGKHCEDPLRAEFLAMMESKLRRALQGKLASSCSDEQEICTLRQVLDEISTMKGA